VFTYFDTDPACFYGLRAYSKFYCSVDRGLFAVGRRGNAGPALYEGKMGRCPK